jgi:hypothetical protein
VSQYTSSNNTSPAKKRVTAKRENVDGGSGSEDEDKLQMSDLESQMDDYKIDATSKDSSGSDDFKSGDAEGPNLMTPNSSDDSV